MRKHLTSGTYITRSDLSLELFTTDKVTNCYVKRCVKYYFTKLKKKMIWQVSGEKRIHNYVTELGKNRQLKQQRRRRRRLRKRHLKSELALSQTLSPFFHHVYFVKCGQISFGVEFWRTVSKYRKRKRKFCLVLLSSTKREIRHFHARCSRSRELTEMYKKAWCRRKVVVFANLTSLSLFCRSRCRGRRRYWSSPGRAISNVPF